MRELKFRGFNETGKKWVYGSYFTSEHSETGHCILRKCGLGHHEVSQKSVGQYAGLKDKCGVEIYETDILECDAGIYWIVKFINGCFCACDTNEDENFVFLDDYDFEVIGNIYENPELTKES